MGPRNRFVGHPNCFPHSVGGFCLWRRALPGASSRGVRLHSGTALRSRRRRPSSGHLWVGHMPGQARLWVGVGAIVTFGSISGSVSSDEYRDRFASMAQVRRAMAARDPHTTVGLSQIALLEGPREVHLLMRGTRSLSLNWSNWSFNEQSTSATPVGCPWTQRLDGHRWGSQRTSRDPYTRLTGTTSPSLSPFLPHRDGPVSQVRVPHVQGYLDYKKHPPRRTLR